MTLNQYLSSILDQDSELFEMEPMFQFSLERYLEE